MKRFLFNLIWVLAFFCGCRVQPAPPGQLPVGVARVYKTGPRSYRGPQLTRVQFAALMAYEPGLEWCDVKLNTALPFDGGHDDLPPGWEIAHHPWQPFGPVSHEQVIAALDDEDRCLAEGKAVYRHCLHGEDRTGLDVAIGRMRRAPALAPRALVAEQAWREAVAYGFHDGDVNRPGLEMIEDALEREARLFTGDPTWQHP